MVRHSDYESVRVHEAGRRGGISRARNLSADRRSEIGREASEWAQAKKLGWPLSRRESIQQYLAVLEVANPDLAAYVALIFQSPTAYADRMVRVLTRAELASIYEAQGAVALAYKRKKGNP